MKYDFFEFFKNIDLYALIDAVLLVAVLVAIICFFVYKRNVKVLLLLLAGVILDIAVNVVAGYVGHSALEVARYITHFVVVFDIVAACVVYQNDLKNIFQKVSTPRNIELHNSNDELRAATLEILTACQDMAKQDVGAIIIIDSAGEIKDNILDTGTRLDALLTAPLLESIFITKGPLHDGAVIVRGNRIIAAGCFLTLTQRNVNKEMGTRHRAAIGVTEDTDVLSIVNSEETGIISVVKHGEISRYMTMDKLNDAIETAYGIAPSVTSAVRREIKKKHKNNRFQ
ncbi:MAG: DNA integrity scanning protein DisA nucleotide-binding domain protein [Bacteroides sp.]|nr:DNA integrity scanning protein DisA nucleotide-binding domain protein [Bacillota bacterium]MCM1393847.1 DNA integrity scanning protein DisA nucleotide-binding domain protein [[Eubacterium] siraeum]MCM1455970.1 DNA integrity scanning protein DisA nucleotide-binding domain protein [Bacteroides sp.]